MKKILLLISLIPLFSTAGCVVAGGGRHDEGYRHHDEVVVGPPAVEVRAPTVIVQ